MVASNNTRGVRKYVHRYVSISTCIGYLQVKVNILYHFINRHYDLYNFYFRGLSKNRCQVIYVFISNQNVQCNEKPSTFHKALPSHDADISRPLNSYDQLIFTSSIPQYLISIQQFIGQQSKQFTQFPLTTPNWPLKLYPHTTMSATISYLIGTYILY